MYRHTQIGWLMLISLGLPGLLLLVTGAALQGAWLPCAILLIALLLFCTLTVEVTGKEVTASFGPGLIQRRIPLDDITACTQVRNRWWYGWGLRMGIGGMMFNVSGLDAVDLTLRNGTHFRIGTDEPQKLVKAIQEQLARRRS